MTRFSRARRAHPGRALCCAIGLSACHSLSPKPAARSEEALRDTAARAEQSYAKADWPAAAEAYGVLVEDKPQDTDLWFRYANALARSEQTDKAIAAYREVLARDAHYSKAWFNMGIVQLREAASSFSRMNANVTAEDPLRAQGQQAHDAVMKILGEGSAAKAAGPAATEHAK